MNKYDVCIIGGGVMGCSAAYELSKKGYKTVILEKGKAGQESSGAAAGLLGVQAEWDEYDPLFDLARKSRAMFPDLSKELREVSGIDIGYEEKGIYKIAETEEELAALEKTAVWQSETGEPAELLTRKDLLKQEPLLSNHVTGGVYYPKDGHVIAPALTKAFEQSALHYGTEIFEYTTVEKIIVENGKTAGVRANGRIFHADTVLIAAGAWSSAFLKSFNLLYETYPVKGEIISVLSKKKLVGSPLYKHGFYIVPKRGGRYIIGATVKERDFTKEVSLTGMSSLMETAKRILPSIENANFEKAWSGFRPQSASKDPYMERHPEVKGLYACTGHYRNGILLSPAAGKMMLELMEREPVLTGGNQFESEN
ncbi:glycine oxidase ThiO [Bacillus sp. FJAT-42376]|uniref:glycine oxidase ThiO n=1 Tax=Bacillus sp. FJAT-42376 TaxID=2014076 RepID=UPI000F5144E4|nr:glycine oxidase ThiO [Bacillus sp. FJAT-42376]AZB44176.1 glycine oxidase ThiO [Bacillus sp. FJAT-42376]